MQPAHSFTFESFGFLFEVGIEDADLCGRVADVLPPGARRADRDGGVVFTMLRDGTITRDGVTVPTPPRVTAPLTALELAIRHHLAEHAPDHVFLHAGVVATGGVGIVIPGSSMSGKSVLVEELVRAGGTYYSDEYAVVDRDGLVHPYPKAVVLRRGTRRFGRVEIPPDRIGAAPVRPGLVVLTSYAAVGNTWSPREVAPGEGALALLQHALPARSRPAETLRSVGQVARASRIIASPRGEAPAVAVEILALADARA